MAFTYGKSRRALTLGMAESGGEAVEGSGLARPAEQIGRALIGVANGFDQAVQLFAWLEQFFGGSFGNANDDRLSTIGENRFEAFIRAVMQH